MSQLKGRARMSQLKGRARMSQLKGRVSHESVEGSGAAFHTCLFFFSLGFFFHWVFFRLGFPWGAFDGRGHALTCGGVGPGQACSVCMEVWWDWARVGLVGMPSEGLTTGLFAVQVGAVLKLKLSTRTRDDKAPVRGGVRHMGLRGGVRHGPKGAGQAWACILLLGHCEIVFLSCIPPPPCCRTSSWSS